MVETPVLFETFARPDYAIQVFDQICKAEPSKLYFYSNKARADKPEEISRNNQIRSLIDNIDWDCDLHTYFRDEYVDVFTSLKGAMDWVFENEDKAIILEEDCFPSVAFFEFCDKFLEKYKEDDSIGYLSGCNYFENYLPQDGCDHVLSSIFNFYGFATWKDRWNNWKFDLEYNDAAPFFSSYYKFRDTLKYDKKRFKEEKEYIKQNHSWDTMVCLNCIINKQYGIYPIINLVKNIGSIGFHHKDDSVIKMCNWVSDSLHYPFSGTSKGYFDISFDKHIIEKMPKNSLSRNIKNKIRNIIGFKLYNKLKSAFRN